MSCDMHHIDTRHTSALHICIMPYIYKSKAPHEDRHIVGSVGLSTRPFRRGGGPLAFIEPDIARHNPFWTKQTKRTLTRPLLQVRPAPIHPYHLTNFRQVSLGPWLLAGGLVAGLGVFGGVLPVYRMIR